MARFTVVDDEGWEHEIELPTTRVVCPSCGGRGTRDVWDGGMTRDEMDEQGPDFFEDYMNGHYDRACDECNGSNVVDEIDRSRAPSALLALYDADQQARWEVDAMYAAERRVGA